MGPAQSVKSMVSPLVRTAGAEWTFTIMGGGVMAGMLAARL
jgi:hypothetical protein